MSRYLSITTAIAAVFLAAPLVAQVAQQDTASDIPTIVVAAERLVAPTDSIVHVSLFAPAPASRLTDVRTPAATATVAVARGTYSSEGGHNPAMMIVGGAGILVGAIVGGKGGNAIMVGGGILGLIGLWNYLK